MAGAYVRAFGRIYADLLRCVPIINFSKKFRCDHGICAFNSAADNEVTVRNSNKLSARTAGRTPLFMKHARLMDLYHVACDASRQGYGVGGSLAETVQGRAELVRRSGAGAGDGYFH